MKVLVAEDNIDSRHMILDVLAASGYDTVAAVDGREALMKARDYLPDLVLLDINMPIMDGWAVCAELRNDPVTTQIPIIILTAQADIDSRIRGLGLGADDFLSKPFSPRELLARISTRLRSKAENDSLREQRQHIRKTFERFLSPSVVDTLIKNPEATQLGGAVRDLTILFADLEGFTALSEWLDPGQLLNVLNQYHGLMVKAVRRNGGLVNKFLGDGILALYNTPLELPNHALKAVTTALEIRDALVDFQRDFSWELRMKINFGINTGQAIVGNIGSEDLMDYTAVGDNVNLAQRLQSMSRGGEIMISEATYHQIAPYINAEEAGLRQVRGREVPVQVYFVQSLC
jgi:adenylate cyclase